jgi:membrane-associated phospholipid phosphatase
MCRVTRGMAVAAIAAAALYGLVWLGYRLHWNWLDTMDSSALNPLHSYGIRHPAWVTCWNVFCTALSPAAFRLFALVVAVVEVVRRNIRTALFLVISVGLSGPVSVLAKGLADRPRPATALVQSPSSSFPSGHAVGVMVGVLALLTVLLPLLRGRLRVAAIAVGAVVILAVGVGRVVLNVHHPSDVLAGWALGYVYFCICLLLVGPTRRRSEGRRNRV